MGERVILNIEDWDNAVLATRAARHLIDHPEKHDALLEYQGLNGSLMARMWVRRGKSAVIVYEQPLSPAKGPEHE